MRAWSRVLELRIGSGWAPAGSPACSPRSTMLGRVVDLDSLNHCDVQHVPLIAA